MKKSILIPSLVLLFVFTSSSVLLSQNKEYYGQGGLFSKAEMFAHEGGLTYLGVYTGWSQTQISAINATLGNSISNAATYTFKESFLRANHLGITAMYGIENTDAFILFEGGYNLPAPTVDPFEQAQGVYQDDTLQYAINFNYQKVHLRLMVGAFVIPFVSIQAGFDWGINATPDRITYDSNDATIGRDLEVRDGLTDKLSGQNDFGPVIGVGLNIPIGTIGGRSKDYKWFLYCNANRKFGFTDIIHTYSNNFRLQERQNRTSTFQINAGFRISI